ncbi:MAG TPA: sensor histidine kinase [Acidimicrobiales bacterium]|nr:sensor histidine kinase [Acidimicrobiales bacterium]
MRRPQVSSALLVLASVGWALLTVREQHRVGRSTSFLVGETVVGLLFVGAGIILRTIRPANRCWWLLVGAGLAWYVGVLEPARDRDVALAAFALGKWYELFVVWALLAYPTGRVRPQRDRFLLALVIAVLSVRTLGRLFLHVPPDFTGCACVENRFFPLRDDRWWELTENVYEVVFPALVALALASIAARWLQSSVPGRRVLTPALVAGVALAVGVTYEHVVGWNAALPGSSFSSSEFATWAHGAVGASLAVGLARLRRTRSAVVDLVAHLGGDVAPVLSDALARALGDPGLRLFTWSDELSCYVDATGSVDVDAVAPGRTVTRIEREGRPVAALVHDAALLEDPGLVGAVSASIRLTLDNDRLAADLQTQLAEVAASRARIVAAGDAERQRIERDLHDGAQQRLVTTALALRVAELRLDAAPDDPARAVLQHAVAELTEAIEELRNLARGIHPAVLTESGLGPALESLADRAPVPVDLELELQGRPPAEAAAAVYFCVAEAMTNVAKHAAASSMTVRATWDGDRLRVVVVDDGLGGASVRGGGTGLAGVADRVAAAGGTLSVVSPCGAGTTIVVELPCVS